MSLLGRPNLAAALCLGAAALSCAKARPDQTGTSRCLSWKEDIGSRFSSRCQACHQGTGAAGQYDVSSYAGALGPGSDAISNAISGDPDSKLLQVLDPVSADPVHLGVSDLFEGVRSWVVDCGVSYVRSSIHRGGILDPKSADFHGQLVRDHRYDLTTCQRCHGDDFAGGTSAVSCLGCHKEGPTACSTCHGAIATSASHAAHLGGGALGKSYGCDQCHRVPAAYTDVGHIFLSDGTLDPPPAEVMLGATAGLTPPGTNRTAPPSFDAATQSCSNTYCHGALLGDTSAKNTHPMWNAPGTGQADCGSCHGLPPNHAGSAVCVSCHPAVVDRDGKIVAPDKHIDGQIQLGDTAAGCGACHGRASSDAPPSSLTGATSSSAPDLGAHQAHLTGRANLRGPVACGECHLVPASISSPGHFSGHDGVPDPTSRAEVFPLGQVTGSLASARGAQPRWEPATATCAGVYCHGRGTGLASDTTPAIDQAPVWTAAPGLTCGVSCHGLPPAVSPHLPSMTRLDCVSCHPRTVDPRGTVIIAGAPGSETSTHINGVIDVAR